MREKILPAYARQHAWESYAADLMVDYRQCLEEGRDVSGLEALFRAVADLPPGEHKARLADVLFDMTGEAPKAEGYPYREPDGLEDILALRPEKGKALPSVDRDALPDQVLGAWLGRAAGCLLGKPVEGMRTEELHPLLKESGNWPMGRYIVSSDLTEDLRRRLTFLLQESSFADRVACAPVDDDTNYVVLNQVLVEKYGRDFTPEDVARVWLDYQPKDAYCTAERVAYCNLVKGYQPPDSARWQNPYREWIGAQIRGDYFGYINPGDPEAAACMAWRDASISHVKNGIYGEMFAAAMIAAAAVLKDPAEIVEAGLGQIPGTSRLYEAVDRTLKEWRAGIGQEECFAGIHARWDEHSSHDWCHTISNAVIVTASLLYGGGDFGRSICMAVQTGFDTDCNGATVGSVLGMRGGAGSVPKAWTEPLKGRLETSIFGVGTVVLADMAEKTLAHLK